MGRPLKGGDRAAHQPIAVEVQVHMANPRRALRNGGNRRDADKGGAGIAGRRKGERDIDIARARHRLSEQRVVVRRAGFGEQYVIADGAGPGGAQPVDQRRVNAARPWPAADLAQALLVDRDEQYVGLGLVGAELEQPVIDEIVETLGGAVCHQRTDEQARQDQQPPPFPCQTSVRAVRLHLPVATRSCSIGDHFS